MLDWLSISKETIFSGHDGNGNRYLSQFLADYKKIFDNPDINAGCQRCLNEYYEKMTKHLITMSKNKNIKNSGYVLKAKYNGIPLKFGSRVLVTNANITDEMAQSLLKNHKRGADLFDKIPEVAEAKPEGTEPSLSALKKESREDLNAKAAELGIENPEELPNKEAVAKAILEAKPEGTEEE